MRKKSLKALKLFTKSMWKIGVEMIALLMISQALAQSPMDISHSKILEFPTVYIYPYYWALPVEGSSPSQVQSDPYIDTDDICEDLPPSSKASVMAF